MKTINLTTRELLNNYFTSLSERTWVNRFDDNKKPNWQRRQIVIDYILSEDLNNIKFLFESGYTAFLLGDKLLEDFEDTPKDEVVILHILTGSGDTIGEITEEEINFKFDEYLDLRADQVTI